MATIVSVVVDKTKSNLIKQIYFSYIISYFVEQQINKRHSLKEYIVAIHNHTNQQRHNLKEYIVAIHNHTNTKGIA